LFTIVTLAVINWRVRKDIYGWDSISTELQYLTCCTPPWFHGPTNSRQCFPARAENVAQAVPLVTQDQPGGSGK